MLPASVLAPLAIAVAAQTLPTFSNLAATTLAPRILAALDLPGAGANGYVFLVYLTATAVSFLAASFVLKLGPIRACQWALVIMAAGGLLVFANPTLPAFALMAVMYGAAYVAPIPAGAQILVDNTPARLRNTLFGIRQMGVPLGGLLAGAIYPVIAEVHGWRSAFLTTAVACLALALLLQAARRRYDARREPTTPIFSAGARSPFAVLRQSRALRRLCIAAVAFAGTEVTAVANIVLFLERDHGWSLIHAGYALAALSVGGAIGRLFWGMAADRIERRIRLLGVLGLGMAASMAAVAFGGGSGALFVHGAAFAVGFTAGGWTGVGVAESARLAGAAGAVAGTAAFTQTMFLGVMTLPFFAGLMLAAGLPYPLVIASMGGLAGLGGLLLLTAPPET